MQPVVTHRNPTVWSIELAGDDIYVIKALCADLLWNVESRGEVRLRHAAGIAIQRWRFASAN